MKKFLIRFLIFFAALVVMDKLCAKIIFQLANLQNSNPVYEMKQRYFDQKPDIAILGSSRAQGHYNPAIIAEATKLQVMNYGLQGSGLVSQYVSLATIAQHNQALKYIVLDVKPYEFSDKVDYTEMQNFYTLMPYGCPEAKKIAAEKIPFERFKLASSLYLYNNKVVNIVTAALSSRGGKMAIGNNGYQGLPKPDFKIEAGSIEEHEFYQEEVEWLDSIVSFCKKKNIQLIACISPYYGKVAQSKSIPFLAKYCQQNNVPFANYASDIRFALSDSLYRDKNHLDSNGANLFSKIFAEEVLKKQLK